MKYIKLIILVLSLGVVACEGTVEFSENGAESMLPGNPGGKADSLGEPTEQALNGEALYQQYCGSCHGMDATGGASFPSSIVGFTPIDDIVNNGYGAMPPIPMQPAEVAAVQDFLLGNSAPAETETEPTPAPTTDGSTPALEVFAQNCAGCHGNEGQGNAAGPPIRTGDHGLLEFAVRDGRNGVGNPSTMPTYTHGQITDEQLNEISDWLTSFPQPTTGEGLYNRYCSTCHGMDGAGGTSFEPVAGHLRAHTIIRTGHALGRYADRGEYMPAFSEEQLSDDEIVMIEQYIRSM